MTSPPDRVRRLEAGFYWFEEIATGDWFATGGMTVTESHIVAFAGLSGDFFDVHMDEDEAKALGFPGRIAHGILGLALVDGLKNRAGVRLRAVASLGWNWSFAAPILIGDRIAATVTVGALRRTRSPGRAIASLWFDVANQRGETVQKGENVLMLRCRDAEAG